MPGCYDILNQIIARSGLDRKDGHPLYRYRVTLDELDLLKTELTFLFQSRGNLRMPEEFAAFCLFGAEWFRRNYQSGPWSWEVIFDGLKLHGSRRPATQSVYEYVERGLRFWRTRLLSTELMRLFLRTLVCQGGFPIHTLRNEGAGLSRMLKACLRDHERYPTESMDEVLSRYIHYVPLTLQIGEVRRLAADLVQAIAQLRMMSDDAQSRGVSRLEHLDQTAKGWEVQLPLRVEEPEAKELLLSLLDAAKAEPFSRHSISVSTAMSCDGGNAFIVRALRCPGLLSEEDFRRACRVDASKELLPRMTGYLQAGDQRVPAISISRSNDGSSFRLTKHPIASLSGSQALCETALVLAVGGEEIERVSIPGGEALPESPWIFTSDESHQLIGVGSARPRDDSVLVALPTVCEVKSSDGAELSEQIFTLAGRKLVKLTGEVRILCDDLQYRIATKSDANQDCLFELRGKSKRLGTGGSQVWCGPPTVWQIPLNEDAAPSEVPREQLQWKPVRGGAWSGNFANCLGHVQIRAYQAGDTRYLSRAIVMPPNIALQVVPGSKSGTGVLRINGLGKCQLAVERNENIVTAATRKDGVVLLQVEVKGQRPGLIRIRVTFDNDNSCDVCAVCPTTCFSILDVLGHPVEFPSGIPSDNLDGLTLQAIQPEQRSPLIYWPDGSLLIDRMRETNVPGVFEFPLSYIANYATELLACSDDTDGKVKFGIGNNVAFPPKFTWYVSRYSHALDRTQPLAQVNGDEETTGICVKGLDAESTAQTNACDLSIVPLGSPNDQMPAETIIATGYRSWIIRHSSYSPGYYLALAKDAQGNSYRPLRFVVKASELKTISADGSANRPQFLSVMNMHDKPSRLKAWDNYIQCVSQNPAHPDWAQLDDFVNSSETLPVTTFEAVSAITRNHFAAARYGVFYPHRERLWRRFEQLPFLWSAIPIHAWLVTALKCRSFAEQRLRDAGFSDSELEDLLGKQRDLFVKESPNRSLPMSCVVLAMFASGNFGINDPPLSSLQSLNLNVRERERSRLIAHHHRFDTRSTWPNFRIDCLEEERDILKKAKLEIDDRFVNEWAVLNGPAIAAVKAVYGNGIPAESIAGYKRLRALDPDWYDIANAVAMYVLLSNRCNTEKDFLSKLLESVD